MRILLATSNPHKRDEILAVCAERSVDWDIVLLHDRLAELGRKELPEPVEDQDTFEGNAVLKARYYAAECGMTCLADDSGLEVDALGGAPGVISARYSGVAGGRDRVDPANNAKLLRELDSVPIERRTARFVCALAMVNSRDLAGSGARPTDAGTAQGPRVIRGTVEGRILMPEECSDPQHPEHGRGTNGFGYDPLFELTEIGGAGGGGGGAHSEFAGKTTAELTPAQKNHLSHRGNAVRKLLDRLGA